MLTEPVKNAHVIRSDSEALAIVQEVAQIIRQGAIVRDQNRHLPRAEIELLSERGIYGLCVPKKFGGAGISGVTLGKIFRILAAADPSVAQIPQNHFCWAAVLWLGTPEQEAFFFERFLGGERLGNAASENSRRRPGDHETTARKVAGGYHVNGRSFTAREPCLRTGFPCSRTTKKAVPIFSLSSKDRKGWKSLTIGRGWDNEQPRVGRPS
jgi:alkylation response protein AidB-like acyl-CoA dehydrogenase